MSLAPQTDADALPLGPAAPEAARREQKRAPAVQKVHHWPEKILQSFWMPVLIVGAWELSVRFQLLDPLFFPPPSALLASARHLIQTGELGAQLSVTLYRTALGFAFGFTAGLICGVLMGTSTAVERCLEPLVSALYTTPKMSLLPMVMLLAGVGDVSRVFLISLGSFIMMAMHAFDAVRGVNRRFVEIASSYGAGRGMLFRKVYFPAALPQVFTGTRLSLGRALTVTVAIELVSCPDGIGSMIWMGWQTFSTEKLYIGVILAASMGAILHRTLRWLEQRLIPWKVT